MPGSKERNPSVRDRGDQPVTITLGIADTVLFGLGLSIAVVGTVLLWGIGWGLLLFGIATMAIAVLL